MSSRLSVVFYIILCFEIGLILTVLPWVSHGWLGLSDWGNNYFLLLAAHRTGYGVQRFVSSGWVRGAVSGLGVLNLAMGFWELTHFRQTVHALDAGDEFVERERRGTKPPVSDDSQAVRTDPLSDYPRRNR